MQLADRPAAHEWTVNSTTATTSPRLPPRVRRPGQPGKHERQQGRQDDCDLRLTGFGPGRCRGCDLRGNDLSALTGAPHLKHVIVDRAQTSQLGEALAAELDLTFGDDVPGHL